MNEVLFVVVFRNTIEIEIVFAKVPNFHRIIPCEFVVNPNTFVEIIHVSVCQSTRLAGVAFQCQFHLE